MLTDEQLTRIDAFSKAPKFQTVKSMIGYEQCEQWESVLAHDGVAVRFVDWGNRSTYTFHRADRSTNGRLCGVRKPTGCDRWGRSSRLSAIRIAANAGIGQYQLMTTSATHDCVISGCTVHASHAHCIWCQAILTSCGPSSLCRECTSKAVSIRHSFQDTTYVGRTTPKADISVYMEHGKMWVSTRTAAYEAQSDDMRNWVFVCAGGSCLQ